MDDAKEPDSAVDIEAENARLKAEVEALEAKNYERRRGFWLRVRKICTPILIALTCLSLIATTVAVWVNRTVWNPDKYLSTVVPLGDDPAIINALATQITDQAFVALNVQQRVEEALTSIAANNSQIPDQITFLAAPITDSLHKVIREQVVKFLESDQFQQFWATANEQLHPKIVALLQGDYSQLPNIKVGEEDVQLNLIPIVTQVLRNLVQQGLGNLNINVTIPQIPENDAQAGVAILSRALGVTLPADFGQVTIMSSAQLAEYQTLARDLHSWAVGQFILTFILLVLSIAIAPRRRRAVVWLGAGTVVALIIGRVLLRNLRDSLLATIHSFEARNAAKSVFVQLGGSLKHTALMVGWIAVLIALIAYLAGKPAWLMAVIAWGKRLTAPQDGGSDLERSVAAHPDVARVAAAIVAVFALFKTGIDWVPVIVIGGLLALFMWWVAAAQHKASGGSREAV